MKEWFQNHFVTGHFTVRVPPAMQQVYYIRGDSFMDETTHAKVTPIVATATIVATPGQPIPADFKYFNSAGTHTGGPERSQAAFILPKVYTRARSATNKLSCNCANRLC
jgi:hypothetical protein